MAANRPTSGSRTSSPDDTTTAPGAEVADAGAEVANATPSIRDVRKAKWRSRVGATLEVIRANPTGRIALKVFIGLAGLLVVAVGAVLIPLPGPGWLIVLGGIGIWAVEFSWARKLLGFTRRQLSAWTLWVTRQSWLVRILLGLGGTIFVGVVVWLSLLVGFDLNLVTSIANYLATH